jgi:O-antigen ligase
MAKSISHIFSDSPSFWRSDAFDAAALAALIAGLVAAPLWLGGNRLAPWAFDALYFPGLAALYEIRLLTIGGAHPVAMRNIAGPAVLFVAALLWGAAQASTVLPQLFPQLAHPIWAMTADALKQPLGGAISVNPGATRLAMLRMMSAASVFWLALQLSRSAARGDALLRAIGAAAAVYAALGLVLTAAFGGAMPFSDTPAAPGFVRATFVNRNSFATYAGMGLIVITAQIWRLFRDEAPQGDTLRRRVAHYLDSAGRGGWLSLGMAALTATAVLGTVSRGGVFSVGVGLAAFFALSLRRERRLRSTPIEPLAFAAAGLVALLFFSGDLLFDRLAVAGVEDRSRAAVYDIVARAIFDAPVTGVGQGAFADVFPIYRDRSIATREIWDKAHNSYLECWLEQGLIFGTAQMAAIGWLILACVKGAVARRRNATPAIAAASVGALVATHALVDFSLQIEAVALTFSAILGVGVAQSQSSRESMSD